jgi:hypothetical protein
MSKRNRHKNKSNPKPTNQNNQSISPNSLGERIDFETLGKLMALKEQSEQNDTEDSEKSVQRKGEKEQGKEKADCLKSA